MCDTTKEDAALNSIQKTLSDLKKQVDDLKRAVDDPNQKRIVQAQQFLQIPASAHGQC